MLLIASYIFYGWWDVRFLFLIALTTATDFCAALIIDQQHTSARNRFQVSAYVILSAFFFVTVQWTAIDYSDTGLRIAWESLFAGQLGWAIFLGTSILVAVSNFCYPILIA
jgi:hypothetical protein